MKIRIRNAADFIKYYEFEIEFDTSKAIKDIIPLIFQKISTKLSQENLKLTIIQPNIQTIVSNYDKSLAYYNFKESDSIQVEKHHGLTINHSHGICLGYLGPIIIIFYFLFDKQELKNVHWFQIIAAIMILLHYSKRIYEVYFVHINAIERIAIDKDYLGFFFYYWIVFGILVGYELFSQDFEKHSINIFRTGIFIVLFLYSEINNYKSHLILREIKLNHKGQRAIPYGNMFDYVSSSHYFWELCSWLSFSLLTNLNFAYLFTILSFLSMGVLSYKKHLSYLEYFKDKYPRNRKAFIPFIL